jgi:hypothetical protein
MRPFQIFHTDDSSGIMFIEKQRCGLKEIEMAVDLIKISTADNHAIYITTPSASSDRGGTAGGRLRSITETVQQSDFQEMVVSVANLMKGAFDTLHHASKVTIEIGLDIGWENGQLIALLLRGKVDATFKLTIEWANDGKE